MVTNCKLLKGGNAKLGDDQLDNLNLDRIEAQVTDEDAINTEDEMKEELDVDGSRERHLSDDGSTSSAMSLSM